MGLRPADAPHGAGLGPEGAGRDPRQLEGHRRQGPSVHLPVGPDPPPLHLRPTRHRRVAPHHPGDEALQAVVRVGAQVEDQIVLLLPALDGMEDHDGWTQGGAYGAGLPVHGEDPGAPLGTPPEALPEGLLPEDDGHGDLRHGQRRHHEDGPARRQDEVVDEGHPREPQGGHLTGPPFGGGLIEVERGAGAVLDAEVPERAGLPAAPGVRRVQAVGGEHAAEVVLAQRLEGLGVQRVGAAPLAEGPELPGVGPDAGVGGILRVIPALEAGQDAAARGGPVAGEEAPLDAVLFGLPPRRDEAVGRRDAVVGEADGVDHAVAIEPGVVAVAVDGVAGGAVAEEAAPERCGQDPCDGALRAVVLLLQVLEADRPAVLHGPSCGCAAAAVYRSPLSRPTAP